MLRYWELLQTNWELLLRKLKIIAEKLIIIAEKLIINAEKLRISAKKLRIIAEKLRNNTEKLRIFCWETENYCWETEIFICSFSNAVQRKVLLYFFHSNTRIGLEIFFPALKSFLLSFCFLVLNSLLLLPKHNAFRHETTIVLVSKAEALLKRDFSLGHCVSKNQKLSQTIFKMLSNAQQCSAILSNDK